MWKKKVKSQKKEGLKKVLSIYQKKKEIDIKKEGFIHFQKIKEGWKKKEG